MRNSIVILLIAISTTLCSQEVLTNFTSLKAEGNVPIDFIVLSEAKYSHDYISNQQQGLDKDFFLSTRFLIDEILHAGNVLYGDTLTNYVTKVAHYILGPESALSKKLRFYVLKSNTPNAFSTDQGLIFITTGLLSRLENEAQLAFVLAHEISHFTSSHVRQGYVKRKTIVRKGYYTQTQYDQAIGSLSKYNHSLEYDADMKGIELLKNTDYISDAVLSAFRVLKSCHLPFEEKPFNTLLFNGDYLQIPQSYFPKNRNPLGVFNSNQDAESITHPNVDERIEKSETYFSNNKLKGIRMFHFPEEEFYLVRDLSRFESINQHLRNREYVESLFEISILRQSLENIRFLDLSLVKSIYGLVKYKNHNRFNEVVAPYSEVDGEISILHGFFNTLPKSELNILAYRIAFDMVNKYPNDLIFMDYLNDLKRELIFRSGITLDDLRNKTCKELESIRESLKPVDILKDTSTIHVADTVLNLNQDSIKSLILTTEIQKKSDELIKDTDSATTEVNTVAFGLCDIFENEINRIEFEKIKQTEHDDTLTDQYNDRGWRITDEPLTGISKVVVVDPVFQYYNLKDDKKQVKSERRKVEASKHYKSEKKKFDLDVVLLDSKQYNSQSVDIYNDLGTIKAWSFELALHGSLDMISSMNDEMNTISEKYGTSNYLFTGFFTYRDQHNWTNAHSLLSLGFYTIPFLILDILVVHNNFEFVNFVINSETEKIDYVNVQEVNMRGHDKTLSLYVYDVLYLLSCGK